MEYGYWSLLPPLVAILLAILTKQVFISLLSGIFLGYVVIQKNVLEAFFATIHSFVRVFEDAGNTRTIMFCALVGALILLIQLSGGVTGFIHYITKKIEAAKDQGTKRKKIQLYALLVGILIFVESSISVLTVGAIFRPVFDSLRISREKLAYIADSSSAPNCILIPFNGWGAYIMGLLLAEGFAAPFSTLMSTIPYNFYPILALILLVLSILFDWNIGPMRLAEQRIRETGLVLSPNAQPVVSDEISNVTPLPKAVFNPANMLIPVGVMVLCMPIILLYSGFLELEATQNTGVSLWLEALGKGSGSLAVLVSVILSILVACGMYFSQRIMTSKELVDAVLKGIGGLMPLALIMMLAFSINSVCKELGTGLYIAEISKAWLSPALVPALLFVISGFIAFSTGTSWGTFAIMMSIGVPMAETLDAPILIAIAAVLGGGVFGDHCSPISDTTIISSMAANTDHIDHVRTQLPYAAIAGVGALILYLVAGAIA